MFMVIHLKVKQSKQVSLVSKVSLKLKIKQKMRQVFFWKGAGALHNRHRFGSKVLYLKNSFTCTRSSAALQELQMFKSFKKGSR